MDRLIRAVSRLTRWVKRSRKAIIAGTVAGLAVLLKADADDVITTQEWIEIALAVLGSGGLTYAVPNAPKAPSRTPRR